jgi:ABC-type Fe3+/spermidine/putrescine transport system ATPase subunit
VISLRAVSKSFGTVRAVESVSLDAEQGEIVVLQGPSGGGKTTLLRLIAGLEVPDEGEIWLDGRRFSAPQQCEAPHSRGIGMVFQRSALWPHMTVAGNIRFVLGGDARQEAGARLSQLLEALELGTLASRYPSEISGGQARRAALARALAPKPRRLLLDEPLTSLDPALRGSALRTIVQQVAETGATLLYVTHDEEEAGLVKGRMVRMDHGRLAAR